jgi:GTP-binding protein
MYLLKLTRRFSRFFPRESDSESDLEFFDPLPVDMKEIKRNLIRTDKIFRDVAVIKIQAGNGGAGSMVMMQPRSCRKWFPAGGDGGKGGDIYLEASTQSHVLPNFRELDAENGADGQSKDKNGAAGRDLVVKIPVGTVVSELSELGKKKVIADLNKPEKIMVAKGGEGGAGNKRKPGLDSKDAGKPGEQKKLLLELKLLADIGLVGFPNAGKTSLLASLTGAVPKIASYPFTTMRPYIGVVKYLDGSEISIADIPGLIEGASMDRGLGHAFLKHITRTKALLYVLDVSENPIQQLITLYNEVKLYDSKLLDKPYAIILNKIDLVSDRNELSQLQSEISGRGIEISAKYGMNLPYLVESLQSIVRKV